MDMMGGERFYFRAPVPDQRLLAVWNTAPYDGQAFTIQLHLGGQEPFPSGRFLELVFKCAVKRPS